MGVEGPRERFPRHAASGSSHQKPPQGWFFCFGQKPAARSQRPCFQRPSKYSISSWEENDQLYHLFAPVSRPKTLSDQLKSPSADATICNAARPCRETNWNGFSESLQGRRKSLPELACFVWHSIGAPGARGFSRAGIEAPSPGLLCRLGENTGSTRRLAPRKDNDYRKNASSSNIFVPICKTTMNFV